MDAGTRLPSLAGVESGLFILRIGIFPLLMAVIVVGPRLERVRWQAISTVSYPSSILRATLT